MPIELLSRPDASVTVHTSRFGPLPIDKHGLLTFPEGLPGFESRRTFVLVPHPVADDAPSSPFQWLQSTEDGELAFLAIDPARLFPHYAPRLAPVDLAALELDGEDPPHLYALLTVPKGDPCGITANLMAPVVVNPVRGLARQVVVNGDEWGLRHRLLPA